MRVCIAGKNNIAVNFCQYLLNILDKKSVFVIVNKTDTGENGFQRSFLKYAYDQSITLVSLEEIYNWGDLIFISLEFDRIIHPEYFKSSSLYNLHFSLLPKYKGMYTSALPLLYGEKETGVTLHKIDQGIDTGNILYQKVIPISKRETAKSLYLKYIDAGTKLMNEKVHVLLRNKIKSIPQTFIGATYFSKTAINYSNLQINVKSTADQIVNQVRAFNFRDYQMARFAGYDVFYAVSTQERSSCIAGNILEDNNKYIKLSTIDYNVLLYKDKLKELMTCCQEGNLEILEKQDDIEYYIDEREIIHGWNLLMVAAYYNRKDIVKFLLLMGANINSQNNNGTTVLMYAKDACIRENDYSLLFYLLEHGANIFLQDYYGKNLLHYIKKEKKELYDLLKCYYD